MNIISMSDEKKTLNYLLDLLNGKEQCVVAVSVAEKNMRERLEDLLQHYTKVVPKNYISLGSKRERGFNCDKLGKHFYMGDNLVMFLALHNRFYNFQKATHYVKFAPQSLYAEGVL